MHLVPCRWSKSGWKYVESDPSGTKFFTNPNRNNKMGYSPEVNRDSKAASFRQAESQYYKNDNEKLTTYGAFFKP